MPMSFQERSALVRRRGARARGREPARNRPDAARRRWRAGAPGQQRCVGGVLSQLARSQSPETLVGPTVVSRCDRQLRAALQEAIRPGGGHCTVDSCLASARRAPASKRFWLPEFSALSRIDAQTPPQTPQRRPLRALGRPQGRGKTRATLSGFGGLPMRPRLSSNKSASSSLTEDSPLELKCVTSPPPTVGCGQARKGRPGGLRTGAGPRGSAARLGGNGRPFRQALTLS